MRLILTIIPFVWIILAIPFVNTMEPRIGGLPFVAFWIQCGVVVAAACIHTLYMQDKKKRAEIAARRK